MWQNWATYVSDSENILVIPVYHFLTQENNYKIEYVYVFLGKRICAIEMDDELFVWPTDRWRDWNDRSDIWQIVN